MPNFQKRFFQVILLLLALLFTATVRYLSENNACMTSGGQRSGANVTVSEVFAPFVRDGRILSSNDFYENGGNMTYCRRIC